MALTDLIPDPNAPPVNMSPGMQGGLPQLGTPLMPLVRSERQGQEDLAAKRAATPTGLSSLATPAQGFWQHVRKIAEGIGNVAGDVVAPSTMALIPGTQLHRALEHRAGVAELAGLQKQDTDETNSASENALRSAQTGHLAEETSEMPGAQASEEALRTAQANKANQPDLAQAYAHAVSYSLKKGGDPSTDPIVQHLADAITAIQKQPAPKGGEHINVVGPDGKPMVATYDPVTKKTVDSTGKELINPQPYEKPQAINVNAGDASLDRLAARLGKPYQTGFDAAGSQLDKIDKTKRSIDSGYIGQSLAIPELLTSLVSGQGTGVRITQAELNSIGKGRGVSGDVESFFNTLAGKGKLTDTDKAQMKNILSDAQQRIQLKQQIHKEALDEINGAPDRASVSKADAMARQRISDLETKGFYVGQHIPGAGTVVSFDAHGKPQVDDAR